jgi:maleylacetate reductase
MVVYGEPLATTLPQIAKEFWATQIVLVANTSLAAKGGLVEKIAETLGGALKEIVGGVHVGSPREDVVRIAGALRSKGVDAVVAVGGGSVVDAVKAARISVTNNVRNAADLDRLRTVTTAASPRPYLISIPTTLSAADYTQYAGVTDERTGAKDAFHHQDLAPDAVILDPEATLSTPEQLWLSTGLRALDHAVETWCSSAPTPYSDATSLYAAQVLARALPASRMRRSDLDARLECQTAAWMSIQGVRVGAPHGASHGIGRALSAIAGVPHAATSAILLPHVLRYNLPLTRERQKVLATAMGAQRKPPADVVARLVADLDLPARLRDVNVRRDQIPEIARAALIDPLVKANIRPFESERAMIDLLEAAY